MQAMGLDLTRVANLIVNAFGKQIFRSGFVHSDPHPGNVLVRRGPKGDAEVVVRGQRLGKVRGAGRGAWP